MSTIAFILALLASGLIVGALGRLAVPGRDPMTIPQTILIGIAGSLIAGLITAAIWGRDEAGILLSVIVTALLVYAVRRLRGDRTPAVHGRRARAGR
jgi:uncharacterized membrane protein YeaQ/YmgE (transglycosylase-associated protein family)